MDDIHEYLLLKGVDAVSIHGGKEQEERNEAISLFKVCVCVSGCAEGVLALRVRMHLMFWHSCYGMHTQQSPQLTFYCRSATCPMLYFCCTTVLLHLCRKSIILFSS